MKYIVILFFYLLSPPLLAALHEEFTPKGANYYLAKESDYYKLNSIKLSENSPRWYENYGQYERHSPFRIPSDSSEIWEKNSHFFGENISKEPMATSVDLFTRDNNAFCFAKINTLTCLDIETHRKQKGRILWDHRTVAIHNPIDMVLHKNTLYLLDTEGLKIWKTINNFTKKTKPTHFFPSY